MIRHTAAGPLRILARCWHVGLVRIICAGDRIVEQVAGATMTPPAGYTIFCAFVIHRAVRQQDVLNLARVVRTRARLECRGLDARKLIAVQRQGGGFHPHPLGVVNVIADRWVDGQHAAVFVIGRFAVREPVRYAARREGLPHDWLAVVLADVDVEGAQLRLNWRGGGERGRVRGWPAGASARTRGR